jgi:hypothetical protein
VENFSIQRLENAKIALHLVYPAQTQVLIALNVELIVLSTYLTVLVEMTVLMVLLLIL